MTQSENSKSGQVTAAVIAGVFLTIGACITGAFLVFNTLVDKGAIIIVPSPMPIVSIQPSQISPNNPIATELSPTFAPTPDLWQFYVDDIRKSSPNASVTTEILKNIAAQIPASVPYFAEAEVGLIPYQYNGNVIDRAGPVSLNTPEGGYAYISWGNGKIATNEITVDYQWAEGNAYLVLIIGKSDDGTSADLNTSLELSEFSSGNIYTNFASPAPSQVFQRSIINKAWFAQQLWWAQKNSLITVSIVDLNTSNRLDYKVDPANFAWNK